MHEVTKFIMYVELDSKLNFFQQLSSSRCGLREKSSLKFPSFMTWTLLESSGRSTNKTHKFCNLKSINNTSWRKKIEKKATHYDFIVELNQFPFFFNEPLRFLKCQHRWLKFLKFKMRWSEALLSLFLSSKFN